MRATVRQRGWLVVAHDGTKLNLEFPLVVEVHRHRMGGGKKRVVARGWASLGSYLTRFGSVTPRYSKDAKFDVAMRYTIRRMGSFVYFQQGLD